MSTDFRRCLQGGRDVDKHESDKAKAVTEKRKLDQKKYDAKRKRTAKDTWLEQYTWAGIDDDVLFCEVCRAFPEYSDKESSLVKGIAEKHRKETLKFHEKSVKHVKCIEHKAALQDPDKTCMSKSIRKLDEKNSVVYEKLFNTRLLALQSKNGIDVGTNYRTDKACKDFCTNAAEVLKEETSENVNGARFICILADGSTDKGIIEQELVYVRYVGENGEVKTSLAEIVDLEHGHVHGVKDGWLKGLNSIGVSKETIAEKLVGINTDGASVNLGKKGGAVKLFIDDINNDLDDVTLRIDFFRAHLGYISYMPQYYTRVHKPTLITLPIFTLVVHGTASTIPT